MTVLDIVNNLALKYKMLLIAIIPLLGLIFFAGQQVNNNMDISNGVDTRLTNMAVAYTSFALSKERAGIERAVLSNIFAKDKRDNAVFLKLAKLVLVN